jgi:hypothetical protein
MKDQGDSTLCAPAFTQLRQLSLRYPKSTLEGRVLRSLALSPNMLSTLGARTGVMFVSRVQLDGTPFTDATSSSSVTSSSSTAPLRRHVSDLSWDGTGTRSFYTYARRKHSTGRRDRTRVAASGQVRRRAMLTDGPPRFLQAVLITISRCAADDIHSD